MPQVAVSVILPTHNRAGSLPRAVQSVLAQSFRDLELIVVDDGSTDSTGQIVASIDDPRLRYLKLDRCGGAAAARNTGLRAARGSWVAFQDSDDEWTPSKLAAQLAAAEGTEAPVLVCSWYQVQRADPRRARELVGGGIWPTGPWSARDCYRFPFITPTWLLRRETLEDSGGFDTDLPNLEDWELAFRLLKARLRVIVVDQALVVKHSLNDSLYRNLPARLAALEAIFERHRDMWASDDHVAATFLSEIGRLHCRVGDFAHGRRTLSQALRTSPSAKTALHWLASCAGPRIYRRGRVLGANLKPRHAPATR